MKAGGSDRAGCAGTTGNAGTGAHGETGGLTSITVRFLGGSLVPGLPRRAAVDVSGPVTVDALVVRLEQVVGVSGLRGKLEHHFAVLVNGTSIQHLAGWDTLVAPGADVAVVAPMGGGAEA